MSKKLIYVIGTEEGLVGISEENANHPDGMAWVVGQHKGDEAWVLDEISIPGGATTEQACREFIRRYVMTRGSEGQD